MLPETPVSAVPLTVAGIMTGTSADGIDACVCRIDGAPPEIRAQVIAHQSAPLPAVVRDLAIAAATRPLAATEYAELESELSLAIADVLSDLRRQHRIDLAGIHGQTIWHLPPPGNHPATHQVLDPYAVATATGIPVAWDFRRADMAVGGQGAPLAPLAHWLLFGNKLAGGMFLNLGGIANVTLLPSSRERDQVRSWDTGPGMMLLDRLASELLGQPYDDGGQAALQGNPVPALVDRFLDDQWFRTPPPKSTGRRQFGKPWQDRFLAESRSAGLTDADSLRTAAAITAESVARSVAGHYNQPRIAIGGGGARNAAVVVELAARIPGLEVVELAELSVQPEQIEPVAFALLAYERIHRRPANIPSVTGAARPVVLGSIAVP